MKLLGLIMSLSFKEYNDVQINWVYNYRNYDSFENILVVDWFIANPIYKMKANIISKILFVLIY